MLKAMLVDDEPYILQGLQVLVNWNKEGFLIDALMTNGADALEYLKNHQVDLIITDIQMPMMTGLELLEHINKDQLSDDVTFCVMFCFERWIIYGKDFIERHIFAACSRLTSLHDVRFRLCRLGSGGC